MDLLCIDGLVRIGLSSNSDQQVSRERTRRAEHKKIRIKFGIRRATCVCFQEEGDRVSGIT